MTLSSDSVPESDRVFGLSDNQRSIFYDQIARADSPVYNIGGRLDIHGPIDRPLLHQALQQVVTHNAALRTVVFEKNGQLQQGVRESVLVALPFIDFSGEIDPQLAAERWLQQQFAQSLPDRSNGLYWQFALLKISDSHYILLTKYHHLIADGWSTKIVIDQLAECYNALRQGDSTVPVAAASYRDYIRQETEYLQSNQYLCDAEFWQKTLPVLPEPLLKRKYGGQFGLQAGHACMYRFKMDRPFYDSLQRWAEALHASVYHVLLAAMTVYFARTQDQQRIVVGLPVLNRGGARFKKVIGMFANLSPLAIDVDPNLSVSQLLRHISASVRQVHKHQRYPLSALHQRLQCLKKQRNGVFDWVLSFERQAYEVRFGNAPVDARQMVSDRALYPLAVTVCEFDAHSAIDVIFHADETHFNPTELAWLAQRLRWVLQQFIESPERLLSDIELVPAEELNFILGGFNSPRPEPYFSSVISQFKSWVERTPEAVAVSSPLGALSYRQLDELSDRLGCYLQQQCIEPGALVAVCMPRCLETLVALLAIIKVRAVYVPIDCDSPAQRIQMLLTQSGVSAVLTLSTQTQMVAIHEQCWYLDTLLDALPSYAGSFPKVRSDDLAYIIYTSGTTGQPKGVMIDHQALSDRLVWLQHMFGCKPGDRVGQTILTHFDPSLIEIFVALTLGAELVLADQQRMLAGELAEFVVTQHINAMALVPSSVRLLLDGLPAECAPALRVACCGGEVLSSSLAATFIARTGAQLFNVYGPTETTILASAWPCDPETTGILPIGRPLPGTQILVVDRQMRLMPLAVPGEIVIGGAGVGLGYWKQESLTQASFLRNPFSADADNRLYRSGDYGYIGTDGQLYFVERLDRQVKISGYRIELAEIEQVLMQHPAVTRAAVKLVQGDGQKWLAAYLEADAEDKKALRNELSLHLRRRLPDYMQPRSLQVLESLPLTATGKVDYEVLADPLPDIPHTRQAPRSKLEAQILGVWQQVLQNQELGVFDNFFTLSGDSLTAISLLLALEKLTNCRQSIAFLMTYPSVAEQAAYLEQNPSSGAIHPKALQTRAGNNVVSDCLRKVEARSQCNARKVLYLAASGYGDQIRFQTLADALSEHCVVHVLYPPDLDASQTSIDNIAASYAGYIRQHARQPFFLAGFSIAGVSALETARQLQRDFPPAGLILLDTIYPQWPLQSTWLFSILRWLSGFWLLNKVSVNGRRLQAMLTDPGISVQLAALNRYKMKPYTGSALLVTTQKMRWLQSCLFGGWCRFLIGGMRVERMSGLHGAMFHPPYLGELVQIIVRGLNRK